MRFHGSPDTSQCGGSLAQGANGGLSWVSGTSFAAPVVSGLAAALYSYKPTATPSEIRALALNVLVVATYWLNFQAVRGGRGAGDPRDPGNGAFQVMSLVAPYLAGEARRHFERLGREYLQ